MKAADEHLREHVFSLSRDCNVVQRMTAVSVRLLLAVPGCWASIVAATEN